MLATTARPEQPEITLTTTVAREHVHRAALAEVFLTGWQETATDTFRVTAQWPRFHSFYADDIATYDPMLLCETVRQTFPLLAHAAYGMPMGYALSWSRFQYSVNPQEMDIRARPAELELRVRCHDIKLQRSVPTRMSMNIEVFRDGQLMAVAETGFGCHSPAVYQRLRRGRTDTTALMEAAAASMRPQAALPRQTGRTRARDVVLSPTDASAQWQLRVDTAHPILFDHPLDHAPGMLILEAVRQCAHASLDQAVPAMVTGMDITFNQYIEFNSPCHLHSSTGATTDQATTRVSVEARQDAHAAFTAVADVVPLPVDHRRD
ncbi:transcriptional regulator [Streptomyces sp. 130]|uniref:ScbA/BarX family gamma-butyrolactone biosynthesis protein n=1 Tax=Streptomyces sp. 130 TaxID=2591006 RepID=UPI00117E3831|nr:ScbA/BarX family gamma-butyrolactone biosynthesis protein [Streptomyces sp. 130]TRV75595.1 transcriptional regulator [Streptomyces sp. 130]